MVSQAQTTAQTTTEPVLRLLDQVRGVTRAHHYSLHTEGVRCHRSPHPTLDYRPTIRKRNVSRAALQDYCNSVGICHTQSKQVRILEHKSEPQRFPDQTRQIASGFPAHHRVEFIAKERFHVG